MQKTYCVRVWLDNDELSYNTCLDLCRQNDGDPDNTASAIRGFVEEMLDAENIRNGLFLIF